jgi:hypothetical protein
VRATISVLLISKEMDYPGSKRTGYQNRAIRICPKGVTPECFDRGSSSGLANSSLHSKLREIKPAVIEKDIIIMAKQLGPGDAFPNYTVPTTDGQTLNIPADLKGEYAVIIFYRGVW